MASDHKGESLSDSFPQAEIGSEEIQTDEQFPEGKSYPLNSKIEQLKILASMLGLSARGTAAQTQQVIEGKLIKWIMNLEVFK